MDSVTLATVFVAIATIFLAGVTYLLFKEGKRQANILTKLTLILRSQNDPSLLIKSSAFDLNKLNITVENIGNGPAYSVAIGTKFFPMKQTFYKDADGTRPLLASEVENAANQRKQAYMFYELGDQKLVNGGKEVKPLALTYILINKQRSTLMLPSHETFSYSIDLGFGLQDKNGSTKFFPDYELLRKILTENGVTCFAISLDLVGKNMAEDPIQSLGIASFVVDLKKHSCLQVAYEENLTPHFITIDMIDLAKKGIPLERDFYLNSKSPVNFPQYFEKGEQEGT